MSIYVICEAGINHNGSLETAMRLIDAAKECGADAIKFQKRTIEAVYSDEELSRPRDSVFGATNGDLKRGLEFSQSQHRRLAQYSGAAGLDYSASCWDVAAIHDIASLTPPWLKIPSALITDHALLTVYRETGLPVLVSTGMSTWGEIDEAVAVLTDVHPEQSREITLLACTSTYPCPIDELNLLQIPSMKARYGLPVGFSSHCVSPWPAVSAVALGATVIEAHLTLSRAMWGSDQAASLEPKAFAKMVEEIRTLEKALGTGEKVVYSSELPIRDKLRRKVYGDVG